MLTKTQQRRLDIIEDLLREILTVLKEGGAIKTPGEAELRKAVRASMSGDRKPLELFFAKGGKVPESPSLRALTGK